MIRFLKRVFQVLFLLILFQTPVFAHDVALPVIVDTDMALDDIRAITNNLFDVVFGASGGQ